MFFIISLFSCSENLPSDLSPKTPTDEVIENLIEAIKELQFKMFGNETRSLTYETDVWVGPGVPINEKRGWWRILLSNVIGALGGAVLAGPGGAVGCGVVASSTMSAIVIAEDYRFADDPHGAHNMVIDYWSEQSSLDEDNQVGYWHNKVISNVWG